MGWTQPQLENADLNALVMARQGRLDMLQALFGGNEEQSGTPRTDSDKPLTGGGGKPLELTPAAFDALFPGKPDRGSMN